MGILNRYLEPAILLVGSLLLVLGIGLWDIRAGLALAGLLLILSSIDLRSPP